MPEAIPTHDELMRRALFTPCETKEQLGRWIRVFLGLDLPDATVSEESNSNPLEMIWEVYDKSRRNDDEDYARVMAYASRGGFKTLGASVLEILQVLHLGRNVAHMAAVFDQSKKSQEYVRDFFNKPYIRDFRVGQNVRKIEMFRYYEKSTGQSITERQWSELNGEQKMAYDRHYNYIQIVLCTLQGANCVAPETSVTMADGSQKVALALQPGDRVRSWDTAKHRWVSNEVAGIQATEKQALELEFQDGRRIQLSEDHPVFTGTGWKRARTLKLADSFWIQEPAVLDQTVVAVPGPETKSMDPEQVLWGTLLGDGSLCWPKNKGKRYGRGPRFSLFHCNSQAGLIEIVADALTKLGIDFTVKPHRTGVRLVSKVSEKLVPFFDALGLNEGPKRVTEQVLARLDRDAVAMWFMDDGSGNPELVGSRKDRRITLATCCFGGAQTRLICDWFQTRWKLSPHLAWVAGKHPMVEFDLDDSRRLSELLFEVIHPCVRYKLLPPSGFLDDWCVETGVHLPARSGGGFSRATETPTRSQREWRRHWGQFRALHRSDVLKRISYLGRKTLLDIVLKTEIETTRNFVGNSLILLHNSAHTEFFCVDEVDVVPKQHRPAYEEAKHIPDPRAGLLPITLLTSTRKFSYGLVQQEIANAAVTGLKIRHWNIIDITAACGPKRYEPEKPKKTYYINDSTLRHITEDDYKLLDEQNQKRWYPKEGFAGCQKCPLFAACKGRLATHQTSKSVMLKPISTVITQFKTASHSGVQTQLLCRKPDESGLIYPKFNREVHLKTAAQIASMLTGEPPPTHMTKSQLLQLMVDKGARFFGGMDFGFTHNFATVVGAVFGQFMFIVTVIAMAGLELDEKIAVCEPIKPFGPTIFGDPEAPADIKTFKRRGFHMREWDKYKGSVKAGIEVVRMKLQPAIGDPQLFFLAGDPGIELLCQRLEKYHFMTDAGGQISDEPDDELDDECLGGETEVLTPAGWCRLDAFKPGAEAAAVTDTGTLLFETPKLIGKHYSGSGFRVAHPHLSFLATAGHRHGVMSQYSYKKIKEFKLEKSVVADLPGESYWANNAKTWPQGPGVFASEDEAWLAGFWIAEGCVDDHRPTFLIVDQTKSQWQEEVRTRCRRLGWVWSETKNERSVRFVFSGQGSRRSRWLAWFGRGAGGKRLPVSLQMQMTDSERRQLWEGYMAGDGSRTTSCWHFDTVSKQLAEDLQVLTLTLGYGCRIVSYDCMRAGRLMTNPKGRAYSSRESWRGHVLRKRPVVNLKKDRLRPVEIDSEVFCLRTSTGFFLARHQGKPFVAGNCDALRYMVMNVFSPKGKLSLPATATEIADIRKVISDAIQPHQPGKQTDWMRDHIATLTGEPAKPSEIKTVKRGRFSFDG